MKLNVRKIAQGPALAKGETDCGIVEVNGDKMAGCTTDLEGPEAISWGANGQNGGTVGAQYSGDCSC